MKSGAPRERLKGRHEREADAAPAMRASDIDRQVGDRRVCTSMGKSIERRPADGLAVFRRDENRIPRIVLLPPVGDVRDGSRLGLERGDAVLDTFIIDGTDGNEIGIVRSADGQ